MLKMLLKMGLFSDARHTSDTCIYNTVIPLLVYPYFIACVLKNADYCPTAAMSRLKANMS